MNKLSLIKNFWNLFLQEDFMQEIKGRIYTTFSLAGIGTIPSIEPAKSIINQITKQDVIEILQIISLSLSILVAMTVLYKFIKSLKKGKKENE